MADDTNTAEREALQEYLKGCDAHAIVPDVGGAWHAAFQAGRASLAASAGSEPVAAGSIDHLKLMMEESAWGGQILLSDALANIADFAAARHSPPEGMAGWKPIATAPKEGKFLVRGGERIGEISGADQYDVALVEVKKSGQLDVTNTDAYCVCIEGALEWAPLPASEAKEL